MKRSTIWTLLIASYSFSAVSRHFRNWSAAASAILGFRIFPSLSWLWRSTPSAVAITASRCARTRRALSGTTETAPSGFAAVPAPACPGPDRGSVPGWRASGAAAGRGGAGGSGRGAAMAATASAASRSSTCSTTGAASPISPVPPLGPVSRSSTRSPASPSWSTSWNQACTRVRLAPSAVNRLTIADLSIRSGPTRSSSARMYSSASARMGLLCRGTTAPRPREARR